MSIDWDADLLAPLMAVFGEDEGDGGVTYTPAQGPQVTLFDAVYDSSYSRTEIDHFGNQVVVSFPVLGVRTSELTPAQGDRLTINRTGEIYAVAEVLPDGHGHALLRLTEADAP